MKACPPTRLCFDESPPQRRGAKIRHDVKDWRDEIVGDSVLIVYDIYIVSGECVCDHAV